MTMMGKPPTWFGIAAGFFLLWSFAAIASFVVHVNFDPDDPANPAYDRQLYKALPVWLNWVYVIAVGSCLAGAVALLARRRAAVTLFAISLVAVTIQFGWMLSTSDLIAVKGWGIAAGPPFVIFGLGALALWFAAHARRRGWIG